MFNCTFGDTPVILSSKPTNGSINNCLPRVRVYSDKCMLDIFIEICRDNYVGGNDKKSRNKMIHEIYKQLQLLK